MRSIFNQVIETVFATRNKSEPKKRRRTCLLYKPQMFVSCNKYLGSAWTRHYKLVNYPELTSNQLRGEKPQAWTSPLRLFFITGLSFSPRHRSVIKPWHILDFQTNSWELASPEHRPGFYQAGNEGDVPPLSWAVVDGENAWPAVEIGNSTDSPSRLR